MDYWIETDPDGGYIVYAGDRLVFAKTTNKRDAVLIWQAFMLLEGVTEAFPALVIDEDGEVPGADLVDKLCSDMDAYKTLRAYLTGNGGIPEDDATVKEAFEEFSDA